METAKLRKFAQFARRSLIEQVSAKLQLVLVENSPARRECPQAIKKLEEAVFELGNEQVIERVAYTWFNRFCALRFMDENRYNRLGVVSPAEGQFQPEILADAKMGHIDEEMVSEVTRKRIFSLLDGKTPSQDPQGEAYRLLVVAACNHWHSAMPFLFERIDDYTELLMPDDLLSGNSILAYTREAMAPDACQDVEVIGWLYQFYISEKKDQVFEALKKNQKITPTNIPAATQLFTPHWIVRYLVENSLGRLWMLNRPNSSLIEQMDYYIKPEQVESDILRINNPEEIKICDPACGSGHMLTYAFDLLYAIYEEEGYEPADIPAKILIHNLYGIEIDERAGELAAFALTMKARAKQRRFFRKPVQPNICVLENIRFAEGELTEYMDFIGRDLFNASFQSTLRQFEEVDNFGSLIEPDLTEPDEILRALEAKDVSGQLFLSETHDRVLRALKQAELLSSTYHVVIANPPYAGRKGLNKALSGWLYDHYRNYSSDLYAAFVKRIMGATKKGGSIGLMTPFTWMFISSYKEMRSLIINEAHITSLVRPEYHAFFESAYVPICAFSVQKSSALEKLGVFVDLNEFVGAGIQSHYLREAIQNPSVPWRHTASSSDFQKIPGSPIAYWLSPKSLRVFEDNPSLSSFAEPRQGLITGDNERFLRQWPEVANNRMLLNAKSRAEASSSGYRWFPHHKGGAFRKWYGNHEHLVDWENDGSRIRNFVDEKGKLRSRPQNIEYFFRPAVTWTSLTVGSFNARICNGGFVYDAKGPMAKSKREDDLHKLTGLLNSSCSNLFLKLLAPTMDYNQGPVGRIPWPEVTPNAQATIDNAVASLIDLARFDWDSYETSWDFESLPLLSFECRQVTLEVIYQQLRSHWREMTLKAQRLEEENNHIFIEAYGLQDDLTPDVPLEEITLTCNPHYRYGNNKSVEELEALLLTDTMRELVSYAVGCMLGRYALDKPGLILANQGETIQDYLKRVPEPSFPADDDNVIPMLDGDWFTDDIAERFREFLRIAFGEQHYEENLRFVEQALGKDIRKYFLKDFYSDHWRRYKKRPIYWLFSSPKGSFNALIYMHRYRPDNVSVVLNDYLREFRTKLSARRDHLEAVSISAGASPGEKTKALKDIEKISKIIVELDDYERDVLYPLAAKQIEIDLDDGVKVNYPKFGEALKKISGLS
ncbi:BREX-1 system adenine-specific DNA-methyltransferase PglX [Vreelandella arcis]|uniref:site-specific DNA-methyltransferase (adenine-specific) n=1 Tax=Vreelandella arcis TaxID=416873 RepID=A0A1H0CXG0_9GAMM|nr:BREX-1 system adenine-specific DNA-methyltransferase PglX [Halomonas arcis]SDN62600.1 Methyltransferase domain-containing protein [Halomonas arcis]